MTNSDDRAADRASRKFPNIGLTWLGLLAVLLPLLAIVSPINHDETQYIAAAYLASEGLTPYRDFLYLQTPYQIYAFAPLFSVFAEHGFLAARIVTGMIGAAILAFVYLAQRKMHVDAARAVICCILLWLSHTFIFSVTVVRNDALPALLLAAAILIAASRPNTAVAGRFRSIPWLLTGVLLGLATGTKISFAAPALAFAGYPVWAYILKAMPLREAITRSATIGVGLGAALLPLIWFRDAAPLAFDYGNFGYHAEAPLAWYAANGLEDRLTLVAKMRDVLLTLARGPALFALVIYGWLRIQSIRTHEAQASVLLLIDVLILAGLAATIAPTPTWRQYAMPLLAPLFVGLGLVWQGRDRRLIEVPRYVKVAMSLAVIVGVGQPVFQLWKGTVGGDVSPIVIAREGHYLATQAARLGLQGESVSLSPEVILASGLSLDPTFATGPFAYRTAQLLAPAERIAMNITSPNDVVGYLETTRPDTIVTGYENFDHVDQQGLEQPIEAFARAQGYRRVDSPYGDAVFWFRSHDPGVAR